jgi:hypothetical protein
MATLMAGQYSMQVFISSLISGMQAERQAVKQAILDLGHQPVMAEETPGCRMHSLPILLGLPGITNFLENGGTLEVAQRIAGHADSRTTKLYDRRGQKVLLEDMERVRY